MTRPREDCRSPSHIRVPASTILCMQLEERDKMGQIEDDRLRTVDCLRARLLAERLASKASKQEADNLAKMVEELERKLDEETRSMKRAEKRLKLALKRLVSLKAVGNKLVPQESSSSSSLCPHEISEEEKSSSLTVGYSGTGQYEATKDMLRSLSSEDDQDDLSGAGSSSICSNHQEEGSCSSFGTAQSHNDEEPCGDEINKDVEGQQSPIIKNDERIPRSADSETTTLHQAEREENKLAIVPASMRVKLHACNCKPEVKDLQDVLDALRNVREQLLYSIGRGF